MFSKIGIAAVAFAGVAGAQPEIISGSEIERFAATSSESVQARFKADTTNWDTRIGVSGVTKPAEITGAVANNRTSFENQSFGFELSYSSDVQRYAMVISKPGASPSMVELTEQEVRDINTIRIDATGSRGGIGLTQFYFKSQNHSWAEIPDLAADIKGPTTDSVMLYFGERASLTDGDWVIACTVGFGAFDRSNPGEGVKMTVTMSSMAPIPQPASVALFAVAGMCGVRRVGRKRS